MSSARRNRQAQFSQNFLHDRRVVERLVGEAGLGSDDIVLEIGPGGGSSRISSRASAGTFWPWRRIRGRS